MTPEALAGLLPEAMRRVVGEGTPLDSCLDIMADLLTSVEDSLSESVQTFDPFTTPDRCLAMLAAWTDVNSLLLQQPRSLDWRDRKYPVAPHRLRLLVSNAQRLSSWRGTAVQLQTLLTHVTGVTGFRIEDRIPGRSYHMVVYAPVAAQRDRDLVTRVVEDQKPAYVTHEIVYEETQDHLEGVQETNNE